jgi:hypothetical protein
MVAPLSNKPARRPRFLLGNCFATPGAKAALQEAGQQAAEFFERHQSGDWGEVDADDRQANEIAIRDGNRIMSVYRLGTGVKIWIAVGRVTVRDITDFRDHLRRDRGQAVASVIACAKTDANGDFVLENIPVGSGYSINVLAPVGRAGAGGGKNGVSGEAGKETNVGGIAVSALPG